MAAGRLRARTWWVDTCFLGHRLMPSPGLRRGHLTRHRRAIYSIKQGYAGGETRMQVFALPINMHLA